MYILQYILLWKEVGFMQAAIQKWGNSQGIRIPKAFLDALNMAENDEETCYARLLFKKDGWNNDIGRV